MSIMIAFGHEKNVGKDSAARFLRSHLRVHIRNSDIQDHGFADKGKDICHQLYSWAGLQSRYYYEESTSRYAEKDTILPKLGKSPRQIWIEFMTLVARTVYPYTWVDYLHHNTKCDINIIRDLRFPNEADRIHEHGGYVYKIVRPSILHTSDIADDPLLDYPRWDDIIINDSTLAAFNEKIVCLGDRLIKEMNK